MEITSWLGRTHGSLGQGEGGRDKYHGTEQQLLCGIML